MTDAETQQRIKFLEDRVVLLEDVIKALLQGKDTANFLTAFQLPSKTNSTQQDAGVTKFNERSEFVRSDVLPASKMKQVFENMQTSNNNATPAAATKKEDEIKKELTKPQPEPVTKVDDRSEIIRAHYLPASKQKELFENKANTTTTTTTQQPTSKPADAKPKTATKKTAFQKLMEQQGEENAANAEDEKKKKEAENEFAKKMEAARKKADDDDGAIAKKKAEEEAAAKRAEDEKKKQHEQAEKEQEELEAKKRAEAAAAKQRDAELLAAKKRADDELATKKAQEEAAAKKKRDEELAAAKKAHDEEIATKKRADEELAAAKKKLEEEQAAVKLQAEQEAAAKQAQEELEKKLAEEKLAAQKQAEDDKLYADAVDSYLKHWVALEIVQQAEPVVEVAKVVEDTNSQPQHAAKTEDKPANNFSSIKDKFKHLEVQTKPVEKKPEKQQSEKKVDTKPKTIAPEPVKPEQKKPDVKTEDVTAVKAPQPLTTKGSIAKISSMFNNNQAQQSYTSTARDEMLRLTKNVNVKENVKKVDNMLQELNDVFAQLGDFDEHVGMKLKINESAFRTPATPTTAVKKEFNPLAVKQNHIHRQLIKFPNDLKSYAELKEINDMIYAEQWAAAQQRLIAIGPKYESDDLNQFYINLTWCLLNNNHAIRIIQEESFENDRFEMAEQEVDNALTYLQFSLDDDYKDNNQEYAFNMINLNVQRIKVAHLISLKKFKEAVPLYNLILKYLDKVMQLEPSDTDLAHNVALCGVMYGVKAENGALIDTCLHRLEPHIQDDAQSKAVAAHGYKWLGVVELTQNQNEKKAQALFAKALSFANSAK